MEAKNVTVRFPHELEFTAPPLRKKKAFGLLTCDQAPFSLASADITGHTNDAAQLGDRRLPEFVSLSPLGRTSNVPPTEDTIKKPFFSLFYYQAVAVGHKISFHEPRAFKFQIPK